MSLPHRRHSCRPERQAGRAMPPAPGSGAGATWWTAMSGAPAAREADQGRVSQRVCLECGAAVTGSSLGRIQPIHHPKQADGSEQAPGLEGTGEGACQQLRYVPVVAEQEEADTPPDEIVAPTATGRLARNLQEGRGKYRHGDAVVVTPGDRRGEGEGERGCHEVQQGRAGGR